MLLHYCTVEMVCALLEILKANESLLSPVTARTSSPGELLWLTEACEKG